MIDMIKFLYSTDTKETNKILLQIQSTCNSSNEYYKYFDECVNLLSNKNSLIRNRGLRLISSLAKWDKENKLDKIIDKYLCLLEDEKPITVRECLKSLEHVVKYKKPLLNIIRIKVESIDISKYKDSMAPLIKKDIEKLLKLIDEEIK